MNMKEASSAVAAAFWREIKWFFAPNANPKTCRMTWSTSLEQTFSTQLSLWGSDSLRETSCLFFGSTKVRTMLIESYVVEFKEVKKCISSLRPDDFLIVSANIFALTERKSTTTDLLSDSTPDNHPEALLLVNKEYAKNLLMNEDFFTFLKQSHDIKNMNGVTLHLAFANPDLISELMKVANQKIIDGVKVKSVTHESLLVAQISQERKYKDDQSILKKALSIYR